MKSALFSMQIIRVHICGHSHKRGKGTIYTYIYLHMLQLGYDSCALRNDHFGPSSGSRDVLNTGYVCMCVCTAQTSYTQLVTQGLSSNRKLHRCRELEAQHFFWCWATRPVCSNQLARYICMCVLPFPVWAKGHKCFSLPNCDVHRRASSLCTWDEGTWRNLVISNFVLELPYAYV